MDPPKPDYDYWALQKWRDLELKRCKEQYDDQKKKLQKKEVYKEDMKDYVAELTEKKNKKFLLELGNRFINKFYTPLSRIPEPKFGVFNCFTPLEDLRDRFEILNSEWNGFTAKYEELKQKEGNLAYQKLVKQQSGMSSLSSDDSVPPHRPGQGQDLGFVPVNPARRQHNNYYKDNQDAQQSSIWIHDYEDHDIWSKYHKNGEFDNEDDNDILLWSFIFIFQEITIFGVAVCAGLIGIICGAFIYRYYLNILHRQTFVPQFYKLPAEHRSFINGIILLP